MTSNMTQAITQAGIETAKTAKIEVREEETLPNTTRPAPDMPKTGG